MCSNEVFCFSGSLISSGLSTPLALSVLEDVSPPAESFVLELSLSESLDEQVMDWLSLSF